MALPPQVETAMLVDETGMTDLAVRFAAQVKPPYVLYLEGDLGAGKTTFARAFIRALGHQGSVKSPTYGLLEWYELGPVRVLHMDLYRIENPEEIEFLGITDLFDENTILIAEWPEKGAGELPPPDMTVKFSHSDDRRKLRFEPSPIA